MSSITADHLTRTFGDLTAVDDLTFDLPAGGVVGFVGPNGSGKSTTIRVLLGLIAASGGTGTVLGESIEHPDRFAHRVGALIEGPTFVGSLTAWDNLRSLAALRGLPKRRIHEVLDIVGLSDVARREAGEFSLGMSQRLGIASALLGDPSTVMLDEPVNGLDPEGVLWIRHLLQDLAAGGRTVLVSSHLMSEMALTAEHFLIIGRGKMIADVTAAELDAMGRQASVLVRSDDNVRMRSLLTRDGTTVTGEGDEALSVTGMDSTLVGHIAADAGIALSELTNRRSRLEQTFMDLTAGSVEYSAHSVPAAA